MEESDTCNLGVSMLAGVRSAASTLKGYPGLKRKESEVYTLWRDDSKDKRAKTGSLNVSAPPPSPSGASTQTPVQLKGVSHEPGRSSPMGHLAFGDPDLLKRQLQQMAKLQHHTDGAAHAPALCSVSRPCLSLGPPDGIRLPKGSALSLDPSISASVRLHPRHQDFMAAKPETTEGGSHSHNSSGFLVQQPSSKLWMEAVPMRTGTKASTSYRVYSNAFMEGRRQNGGQGPANMRAGIPSISSPAHRSRPLPPMRARSSAVSEAAQLLASRQRSVEASPAGPAGAHRAAQPPQPMDVVRLAHAAADRVLHRRTAEQPKPADGPAEVDARLGSAGSCDALPAGQQLGSARQRSGSFGQASGGRSGSGRDLDADTVASQLEQERNLAALLMIQDCAAAGAASRLGSAGAQGSSNLIYILRSLQQQSRGVPAALLAQLQTAQDSPRQQLALMRMLRESLSLPNQAPNCPPSPEHSLSKGSPPADGAADAAPKRRPGALHAAADDQRQPGGRGEAQRGTPAEAAPRITHEEALQRLEAQAELRSKPGRTNLGDTQRMSRIGSDPGAAKRQPSGARMRAFPSEGLPAACGLITASRTNDSPGASEALSGPSLIFNDSASSDDRLNPFKQYMAVSKRRPGRPPKSGVPAGTARAAPSRSSGGRAGRPESPRHLGPKEEAPVQSAALGPAKEGLEREAAEILLFLNGTERDEPEAPAAAPESPTSRPKIGAAADDGSPGDAAGVSPLQALVQDIMQQQKQRAQVTALASLPKSVARSELRGSYAHIPSRPEVEPPPAQPVRRKPGRPPKKRPEEAAAAVQVQVPQPILHRQSSAGRLSVLGFAVPSGPRTGGNCGRPTAHQMHSGYSGGRSGRHRSSGSSGNLSERDVHGARSGAYPGGPPTRSRRVHRPADYDSGGEFSGGSSDARSVDSGSWNSKEHSRRARRK